MSLSAAGVVSIELSYQLRGRRDSHGNFYRYRGAVHLASGRTVPIWDVFLAVGPGCGGPSEDAASPMAADDDRGTAAGPWEEMGAGAGDDSARTDPVGADPLDPPPPPLQVVEYYHVDALGSARWMALLWTQAAAGVVLWSFEGRAWELILTRGWRRGVRSAKCPGQLRASAHRSSFLA